MNKLKGQYFLLGSVILAIFILSYNLLPYALHHTSKSCINHTIYSITSHNAYALCNTSSLLYGTESWGYLYCENYNFTHLFCVLQNCSSYLNYATVNNIELTSQDYKQFYIPKTDSFCTFNISMAANYKTKHYVCNDPAYSYWYKQKDAIFSY